MRGVVWVMGHCKIIQLGQDKDQRCIVSKPIQLSWQKGHLGSKHKSKRSKRRKTDRDRGMVNIFLKMLGGKVKSMAEDRGKMGNHKVTSSIILTLKMTTSRSYYPFGSDQSPSESFSRSTSIMENSFIIIIRMIRIEGSIVRLVLSRQERSCSRQVS